MVLPFGDLHHFNLVPLKCHLIISFGRFGLFLAIATLDRYCSLCRKTREIYNTVVNRSRNLLASAVRSNSSLISDLFSECAQYAYTTIGYNNLFGGKHLKYYTA